MLFFTFSAYYWLDMQVKLCLIYNFLPDWLFWNKFVIKFMLSSQISHNVNDNDNVLRCEKADWQNNAILISTNNLCVSILLFIWYYHSLQANTTLYGDTNLKLNIKIFTWLQYYYQDNKFSLNLKKNMESEYFCYLPYFQAVRWGGIQ